LLEKFIKGNQAKEIKYLILGAKARKFIKKIYQGYLAYLMNKPKDESTLEGTVVVKDYPDVFPEELTILPPPKDMEFAIDLVPRAEPVSRTPYRMAPPELKELKEQLEELMSQGYI
jgi:hypothetical protein